MSEYVDWYSEIAPFFAKNGERFIIPRSTKQRAELLLEYSKQIPIFIGQIYHYGGQFNLALI